MNPSKLMNKQHLLRFFISLLLASAGGLLFTFLHIPIPWLLGPMVAMLIGSQLFKLQLIWPIAVRDYGILIVGYAIGITMTAEALQDMIYQLPLMLMMTILLVALCTLTAYIASKVTSFDFPSLLIGCVPGGLSQMTTLATEMKSINLTLVTFLQVTRLMMIVFCIPFVLFSPWLIGASHATEAAAGEMVATWSGLFPEILWYAPLCIAGAWISKKLHFPTAFMVGPLLVMGIVQWLSSSVAPELPISLLNVSQLMIGAHVGLMLKPQELEHKKQTIIVALLSSMLLIMGSLALSYILMKLYHHSAATTLLSLAPGGMDQMSIMAHEVGANLTAVSGYQLFRILFIFFIVSPLLKVVLTRLLKKNFII